MGSVDGCLGDALTPLPPRYLWCYIERRRGTLLRRPLTEGAKHDQERGQRPAPQEVPCRRMHFESDDTAPFVLSPNPLGYPRKILSDVWVTWQARHRASCIAYHQVVVVGRLQDGRAKRLVVEPHHAARRAIQGVVGALV